MKGIVLTTALIISQVGVAEYFILQHLMLAGIEYHY